MKNFFQEFKKFITRGNVIDMAVGVIVGSAFTAIVNGLSNFILKPLINALLFFIMGEDSLESIYTILVPVEAAEGGLDLTQSIYIDWGAFINAVINFFLVAFVLFTMVRIVNRLRDGQNKWLVALEKGKLTKEDRAELKTRGVKITDREALAQYFAEKRARIAEDAEAKAAAEKEAARLEREANPTTEDLLKKILAELQKR